MATALLSEDKLLYQQELSVSQQVIKSPETKPLVDVV